MNCLSICLSVETLARLALGLEVSSDEQAHLQACATCRTRLAEAQAAAERLLQAYGAFERGHEAGRERLLAAIADEKPATPFRFTTRLGGLTTMQRIGLGAAVAAAVVLVVLLRPGSSPSRASAAEQMAESMRAAKSYKVTSEMTVAPGHTQTVQWYWRSPGSYRMEFSAPPGAGFRKQIMIFASDRPGIDIHPDDKTYRRFPPRQGEKSPIMMPERLKQYSGQADRQLPEKEIGGRKLPGFEIDARKLDPNIYAGKVLVWYDPDTNLPAYVDYTFALNETDVSVVWHDFEWNLAFDPKLFDIAPPADYADKTQAPAPLGEQVELIRAALKRYAELSQGEYPRVEVVYGDVTRDKMLELAGIKGRPTAEKIRTKEYLDIMNSTRGFATLNGIQRDNADAAYYGLTVGPKDAGKVLVRWRLDDGKYQVMYGDLRDEVVTAERLKELEK
jgi:outer membrane lipoprotein-sorting protein